MRAALLALCGLALSAPAANAARFVVDDDGVEGPSAAHDSIQAAVDAAAAGDEVAVCPGLYREGDSVNGVVVDKALTIKGAGADKVRIEPAQDVGAAGAESRDEGNVVWVHDAAGSVDLSGVTIASGGFYAESGVVFRNTSGSFSRSRITELAAPQVADFSSGAGTGVMAYEDATAGASFAFTLSETLLEGYGKGGAVIDSRGSGAIAGTATDNVIRGRGPLNAPGQGQNGLQVSGQGASAAIERNLISDHRFTLDESASVAVLLYDTDPLGTSVHDNDLQGNGYGVFNADVNGCDQVVQVDATSNWWGNPAGPTVEAGSSPATCPATPYVITGSPTAGDRVNGAAVNFAPWDQVPHGAPAAPGTQPDSAPTVAIASPSDGTEFPPGSAVAVTADAGDDFGVTRVEFRQGGALLASDSTAPYQATATAPSAGASQAVTATAVDSAGNTTTDAISLRGTADPPPADADPTVSIASPSDGAEFPPGSTVTVKATASDDNGGLRVEFRQGGTLVGTSSTAPYQASVTAPAAGQSQVVTATAVDSAGQTSTDAISIRGRSPETPRDQASSDDRPPAVTITSPGEGAAIDPAGAGRISADASDDRGVARVAFLDDGRVVCTDDAAPFECPYLPGGEDVGRNTLIAIAVDGAGQTAVDFRAVSVGRFTPVLAAKTTPKRDTKRPYRYATSGRLALPAGVTPGQACAGGGSVKIEFAAGRLRLPTFATLRPDCTYATSIAFPSRRSLGRGRLTVRTTFPGNSVLAPARAKVQKVRAG